MNRRQTASISLKQPLQAYKGRNRRQTGCMGLKQLESAQNSLNQAGAGMGRPALSMGCRAD
jgi:hypothetical protein